MDLAVEFEFEANYRRIFEAGSAPYIEIGLKWNGCDQNFLDWSTQEHITRLSTVRGLKKRSPLTSRICCPER